MPVACTPIPHSLPPKLRLLFAAANVREIRIKRVRIVQADALHFQAVLYGLGAIKSVYDLVITKTCSLLASLRNRCGSRRCQAAAIKLSESQDAFAMVRVGVSGPRHLQVTETLSPIAWRSASDTNYELAALMSSTARRNKLQRCLGTHCDKFIIILRLNKSFFGSK